jgi:hypothetical protein
MLARIVLGSARTLVQGGRVEPAGACFADARACRPRLVRLARSILAALGLTQWVRPVQTATHFTKMVRWHAC